MDFQNILNGVNFTTPSWDLFVLIVFVVGLFFYMLSLGRDRAFIMLLSTYISLAILGKVVVIQKIVGISLEMNFVNQTAIFLAGIFLIFLVISKSSLTAVFNQGPSGSWFHTLVIGFLQIGLAISIVVAFLPLAEAENLSLFIKSFFVDEIAKFFWLVAPFVVTILVKGK